METTATRPSQPTSLMSTARAVVLLGHRCEVVIHDFSDRSALDHTIVAVEDNLARLKSACPQPLAPAAHTPDQGPAMGTGTKTTSLGPPCF